MHQLLIRYVDVNIKSLKFIVINTLRPERKLKGVALSKCYI